MERVSVIIPIYNSSQYLADCILSVHRQSYPIDEIIVIDDGSNDHPEAVIATLPNHNIRFFRQSNSGPGTARNLGIRFAKGKYLAFLDADDMWEATKIEEQIRYLEENPDAGLVYCHKLWVDENNIPLGNQPFQAKCPEGWIFSDLFRANYISTSSSVVVRKNVIENVGVFNEDPIFIISEDYDLWVRISAIYPCLFIPKALVRYRTHTANITRRIGPRVSAELAALENTVGLIKEGSVDSRNQLLQLDMLGRMKSAYEHAAITLFWAGEYSTLRRVGAEAVCKWYFSLNLIIRWMLSFMPGRFVYVVRLIRRAGLKLISLEGSESR